jgi:CDGSH-type Zn-finger protein
MPYQESPHYIDETPGNKYYCTCGESANKPYCDGSHETKNTGKLPMELEVESACRMAICDCGKTKTSPKCDGSHNE